MTLLKRNKSEHVTCESPLSHLFISLRATPQAPAWDVDLTEVMRGSPRTPSPQAISKPFHGGTETSSNGLGGGKRKRLIRQRV